MGKGNLIGGLFITKLTESFLIRLIMFLYVSTRIKWNLRFVCVMMNVLVEDKSELCFGEHTSLVTICSETCAK